MVKIVTQIARVQVRKDWRKVARHHWSVRWWGAAVVLSFFESFLSSAQPYLPITVSPIIVSIGVAGCAATGLACKFIAQKGPGNGA